MHPVRCVSTRRFRAGEAPIKDLGTADGRMQDRAAFFLGNSASSVTIANHHPVTIANHHPGGWRRWQSKVTQGKS